MILVDTFSPFLPQDSLSPKTNEEGGGKEEKERETLAFSQARKERGAASCCGGLQQAKKKVMNDGVCTSATVPFSLALPIFSAKKKKRKR